MKCVSRSYDYHYKKVLAAVAELFSPFHCLQSFIFEADPCHSCLRGLSCKCFGDLDIGSVLLPVGNPGSWYSQKQCLLSPFLSILGSGNLDAEALLQFHRI